MPSKGGHLTSKPSPSITKISPKSGRARGQGGTPKVLDGLGEGDFGTTVGGSSGHHFFGERLEKVGKNICNNCTDRKTEYLLTKGTNSERTPGV